MKKLLLIMLMLSYNLCYADPLASWNEGPIKKNIIKFVHDVTDKNSPNFVAPADRIATFDNDGTLWVEQPLYTQFLFTISRIKQLAPQHPEWKTQTPFSIILSGDHKAISNMTMQDMEKILAITHSGMSVEDFIKIVKDWLAVAKNPRFQRLYTQDVYKPMLEVMQYLRENNFQIYIVTGGGQEFVRAFSQDVYDVPPSHVIGSTAKTKYTYINKKPTLVKMPEILFIDDKVGKPEAINLFIGRKPIIAFGNSDGDREMLEWTQSHPGAHMMLLVHHDDAKREYAYGPESKVGTFSNALMTEATQNHWDVISMKSDWKNIF